MASPLFNIMRSSLCLCAALAITACLATHTRGQENHAPVPAPPPMKFVPREDRAQLSAARDTKARTRVSIELAESHLRRAEELSARQRYDAATTELGNYQGLIEDALHFLDTADQNKGKIRDYYKRIELALRTYAPRLESIRRITPAEYAVNVKAVIDYTRDARVEALNSFYGDTVVRGQTFKENPKSSGDKSPKESPKDKPDNQP